MSDNQDYQSGYRGHQFHHGMDRVEYERGQGQKQPENDLAQMAGGGQKTEVPGVAFTLLLVAPFIWMVYPVLGGDHHGRSHWNCRDLFRLETPGMGIFPCVYPGRLFFFPGMKLEAKASQSTVYRWVRGILRILLPFMAMAGAAARKNGHIDFNQIPPGTIVGAFFGSVVIYLIFQRLDLICFPALKEIKKCRKSWPAVSVPRARCSSVCSSAFAGSYLSHWD